MSANETIRRSRELWELSPSAVVSNYSQLAQRAFEGGQETGVPVVICALNEAPDIAATLASLAVSDTKVFPVVVDNGSTDETLELARNMGAKTLEEPTPNKLQALKKGVSHLIRNLEQSTPILFTDADTIVGHTWASSMLRIVQRHDTGAGGLLSGRVVFASGDSPITDKVRSTTDVLKQIEARVRHKPAMVRGANMAIWFDGHGQVAQGLAGLEASFPQDVAIRDQIGIQGGIIIGSVHPATIVVSKGDRYRSLSDYLTTRRNSVGRLSTVDLYRREYGDDHPAYNLEQADA